MGNSSPVKSDIQAQTRVAEHLDSTVLVHEKAEDGTLNLPFQQFLSVWALLPKTRASRRNKHVSVWTCPGRPYNLME